MICSIIKPSFRESEMAAHPIICSPDYLKTLNLKQKIELVKIVDREMNAHLKHMANDLDESPAYGKVRTMIQNGAKFEEVVDYLNKNYYFAKMPKEYLFLYQSNTLIHIIELYNHLKKPTTAFIDADTDETEPFNFMVSSSEEEVAIDDEEENKDVDDFINTLLKK